MAEVRGFATHRCEAMPGFYSLRRYATNGKPHQYPEPGGWVLARRSHDWEWLRDYLQQVTPFAWEHVRYCPWCGERLEEE